MTDAVVARGCLVTELDVQLSRTVAAMVALRHDRRDAWTATGAMAGARSLLVVALTTLVLR